MKKRIWMVFTVVGLFAWLSLGLGIVSAQSDKIYPVYNEFPFQINRDSLVTLSVIDPTNDQDITNSWLPEPGKAVQIEVNGLGDDVSMVLVADNGVQNPVESKRLVTSAYAGVCTNFGDPTDTSVDFSLIDNMLTPNDSGGMAVVKVNELYFILPQDSNFNGIPDIYEAQYGGNLWPKDDIDVGPDAYSPIGDGIANFDEYRGFKVGDSYVRGDPTRKDLFVHLNETAQCMDTAGSFDGDGGTPVSLAYFFTNQVGSFDYDSLFTNVNTLAPDVRIHRINDDEWVSNFEYYDKSYLVILSDTDPETAKTDRWINKNAVYPLGASDDSGRRFVKGVRIIECLDLSAFSPLGRADKNPPDGFRKDNGNAVLFVHRIVNSMLNMIGAGERRRLQHYTFVNGNWALQENDNLNLSPLYPLFLGDVCVSEIMKTAFAWYLAHEALEHAFDVTSTVQGTRKVSYGYHHAEGSGTNVDIKFTNKIDKSASGYNKFYIPIYHGTSDEREMRVLSSQ